MLSSSLYVVWHETLHAGCVRKGGTEKQEEKDTVKTKKAPRHSLLVDKHSDVRGVRKGHEFQCNEG